MPKKTKSCNVIGIIGYGSQGRALALNLRDSGFNVIIGLRNNSQSSKLAKKEKFPVLAVSELVFKADTICFAFPDHLHGVVFETEIKPNLKNRHCLWFLSGISIHFGAVRPPKNVDIIMLAPHAPGLAVRELFLTTKTLSAFYAIHRKSKSGIRKHLFSLAEGIGIKKNRLVQTTFEHEAIGDLFGEQAVLCGGLASLIKAGFDTLVRHGIPPENAYLEVAYQLDQIILLIRKYGIEGMFNRISVAAQIGSFRTGPMLIDRAVKSKMEKVYREIQSGVFARVLFEMSSKDLARLKTGAKAMSSSQFEKAVKKFKG